VSGLKAAGTAARTEEVLRAVNRFYEEHPFPGFDPAKYRTRDDLARQASWYGKQLDAEIPYGARIIDVGCGTGQLACFLGLKDRSVVGVDYSRHSLQHAQRLRNRFELSSVAFHRMDLLQMPVRDAAFDVVFCNGVLHHTSDPFGGFRQLVRICRPGGYVIVGLYNTYGRLVLKLRRRVVALQARWDPEARERALRKQLVRLEADAEKQRTWWADQYEHPHESTHTVGEVLEWFGRCGVDYVSSVPRIEWLPVGASSRLFVPRPQWRLVHNRFAYFLVQLAWILTLNGAGGYFVIIGRRRQPSAPLASAA
jgi:ubiquinone/menaquinone biosynthesis C-methylase UbiE